MSGKAIRSDHENDRQPDRRRSKDRSRRAKTAIIAYYKAQRRGFRSSGELDEWLSSERAAESDPAGEGTRANTQNDGGAKNQ